MSSHSRKHVAWALAIVASVGLGQLATSISHARSLDAAVLAGMGFLAFLAADNNESPPPFRDPNSSPVTNSQLKEQIDNGLRILKAIDSSEPAPTNRVHATVRTSTTATLTLASSTPFLPFLGNRLVISSYVPNATTVSAVTTVYGVGLAQQSNCTFDESYFLPGASSLNAGIFSTLSGAESYLHGLAGLTTQADAFANGCSLPTLGLPSNVYSPGYLGTTSAGAAIVAELTGNGDLDIVLANPTANTQTTTVLTSNGGPFQTLDLNGDGFIDLVVSTINPTTQAAAIGVYLGNGDGTFKTPVYYAVTASEGLFTVDDVNGDGKPDIVVVGASSITTLTGNGNGTFNVGPVSSATVSGVMAGTGDFNGDGHKDLLVGSTVLFGTGNGSFTLAPSASGIIAGTVPQTEAIADVNKDGKLDVVVSQVGSVSVYLGNGNGTFQAGVLYAALPSALQVTITDVDGDGAPDIVLGTATYGTYTEGGQTAQVPAFQVLFGHGDGTFVDSLMYSQGSFSGNATSPNGYQPQIATADFDGDGKQDVLVFNANSNQGAASTLVLLPGNGTGTLGTTVTSSINIAPTLLVSADINRDGKPDAVVAGNGLAGTSTAGPLLSVLINQGNGTFGGEQDYALPNNAFSVVVGDFNGDGIPDVAVGVGNGSTAGTGITGVYVLVGQAGGTLAAPVKIDSSVLPTGLAAGDVNGDGRADLIVADQGDFSYVGSTQQINGAVHVYLGNANGSFTAAASPSTSATNYSVAGLGDLNGDGKLDLILGGTVAGASAGSATPYVYTLLGNGDGTFQTANAEPLASIQTIGATSIALADVNHDGHLDVVLGNPEYFTEVLIGAGDGTFNHTLMALGQEPQAMAITDLNGDGFPELLVGQGNLSGNGQPDTLTVFLNSSAADAWTAPTPPSTPPPATPSFALTESSASGSIAPGQSATTTLTMTPTNGFDQTVALSCSGLPSEATCSFAPASVAVDGSAATSTLTLSTTAATASNSKVHPSSPLLPGGVLFAGVLAPMALRRRFRLAAALAVLAALQACGGSSGRSTAPTPPSMSSPGTPAGTYTITITATAAATSTAAAATQTATYTLTIT